MGSSPTLPTNTMSRDFKEEILGLDYSEPVGAWGTQHEDGKWYIFPLRAGDACAAKTTVWANERQAREYKRLFEEGDWYGTGLSRK